jgi:hypothetical protein
MRPASTVTPSASVSWIVAAVVKTFPVVTAPSAAKHTAASHIVLIIFQSLRPLRQDSLRFYWSRCAAECLSIVAIPKTQPSSARRSAHDHGSNFGIRARASAFGCLPSRMADVISGGREKPTEVTECAATISRAAAATVSMPFSPPPATTSACSYAGSDAYCAPCC